MKAAELLDELQARGVMLGVKDNRLVIDAPKGIVTPELLAQLSEDKAELLHLLTQDTSDIDWRVAAILPQIPDSGPIPFLVVRKSAVPGPRDCHSCGEPLSSNDGYVCGPCSRAVHKALEIAFSRKKEAKADGKTGSRADNESISGSN